MTRHRLQIISHSFPNHVAPYDATFVRDHASALSEEFEVDVTVPTPRSIPFTTRYKKNHADLLFPEKVIGERTYYFSFPRRVLPSVISRSLSKSLTNHFSQRPPDLIHVHFLYPSGMAIPSLKSTFNCPLILTIHGIDFYDTIKQKSLKKLLHVSLLSADAIIAVGPQLHDDILDHFPEVGSKLYTIHNFVDASLFRPAEKKEKLRFKKELGLRNDRFQLLCVANFRYKKGIDLLIKALELLSGEVEIDLHLVGRRNEEPDFEASVLSRVNKYGLQNFHVHGPLPRSTVLTWMQSMDGFILPSRNEPFGISLIEAMACELPVISTQSGGPEAILSSDFGILIEKENPKALSEAIVKMIAERGKDLKDQRKYIKEEFGVEKYVKSHAKLYKKLLS